MKRLKLDSLSVDELVDRFAQACVAQDQALFDDAYAKFNSSTKKWMLQKESFMGGALRRDLLFLSSMSIRTCRSDSRLLNARLVSRRRLQGSFWRL